MTYVGQKNRFLKLKKELQKVEWKTQTEINDEVLPNTFKKISN